MQTITVRIEEGFDTAGLFGNYDENLDRVCREYGTEFVHRADELIITGERAEEAEAVIRDLIWLIESGESLDIQKVEYVMGVCQQGQSVRDMGLNKEVVCFTHRGKPIRPKTLGQKQYIEALGKNDIVFGVGPAGTGKTYLAVAKAIQAFKNKEVTRIILARPAVEAGERLGFLPGDLQEKVDPYLRPLYDALYDMLGRDVTARLREKEVIEVVPLAYMRGRTLDSSFIILDEAQNSTKEQMKMFLTRLGFGSKAVVTGDITQIDLQDGKSSGLKDAIRVLRDVQGIEFCFLNDSDVVRHPLVRRIINAYERADKQASGHGSGPNAPDRKGKSDRI